MTVSEKDMKPRNYEAHLVELETTIAEKTQLLTDVLKSRESIQQEMDDFVLERQAFYVKRDELENQDIERNQKESLARAELAAKERDSQSKLIALHDEIRLAERSLARINNSCILGNKELETKNIEISVVNDELTNLVELIAKYEDLKLTYTALQVDVEKSAQQLQQIRNDSQAELMTKDVLLVRVSEQLKELESKRDRAAFDYKDYTDRLYTAMNDWQIIKQRIEVKWNQTFPELVLPLDM